jgi:hypothetical protein
VRVWNANSDLELFCPSCGKRLFWSFSPVVLIIGYFLAIIGFDRACGVLSESLILYFAYFFSAFLGVPFMAIRILPRRGILDLAKSTPKKIYGLHAGIYMMLIFWTVNLMAMIYFDLIQAKHNLKGLEGRVVSIEKKDTTRYLTLSSGGTVRQFYYNVSSELQDLCPEIDRIKPGSSVRILADKTPNILGLTPVWELVEGGRVLMPYDVFRRLKLRDSTKEFLNVAFFEVILLLMFFVTSFYKKIEERKRIIPDDEL